MNTALGINLASGKNFNVAISEDSFVDREILRRYLNSSQFNVLPEVRSKEEIFECLKDTDLKPDILFMSFQMDSENAFDTIKALRRDQPNLIIFLLINNIDREVILYLGKLKINSFILKPLNRNILTEKLIQLLGRKDLVTKSILATQKKIVKLDDLHIPSLPRVTQKILMFESDTVKGSTELEQIILPDKSISADLLRIANSAFYARSKKIQTIKDSITLLGLNTVKNIVMLQTKKNISKNIGYLDISRKYLFELPILNALVAYDLCGPLGLESIQNELFLLAVMQRIGMTVLAINYSSTYIEILNQYENTNIGLLQLENDALGTNYIEVGTYIFKKWLMPSQFFSMMKNQNFTMEEFLYSDNYDRILRAADIVGRKMLSIPVPDSEIDILHSTLKHYKAPQDTMKYFGQEYYSSIKSHPFFDVT
jgi:HD-like signal output (HDOD) protein